MWTEEGNGTLTSQAPVSQFESSSNHNPAGVSNSSPMTHQSLLGLAQGTTTDLDYQGFMTQCHSGPALQSLMLARALHILINCVRNHQITNGGLRFTEPDMG
jgi:hypothetical protein